MKTLKAGLIGARGHVGKELIPLLLAHPQVELELISSRELEGQPVQAMVPEAVSDLHFRNVGPEELARAGLDVCFLALPNGYASEFVQAVEQGSPDTCLIDLSGDHRFDDAWVYGLSEYQRLALAGARRISNPGCYATGMQLAIRPYLDWLAEPPVCFGVSGYSGAGTKPSPKNDLNVLRDNLLPYALANHLHEEEVSHQMNQPVHFSPHVAQFFRGISLTIHLRLQSAVTYAQAMQRLREAYENEPLVQVSEEIPEVKANAGRHHAVVGGLTLGDAGQRLVLVATLDNLLKGAATQAVQNMNLAFGFEELTGIAWEEQA